MCLMGLVGARVEFDLAENPYNRGERFSFGLKL